MLVIAGWSVSSRKYQVVHQASCRYDKSANCAIRVNPKLQACARILAWHWTRKSGAPGSAPSACSRCREKLGPTVDLHEQIWQLDQRKARVTQRCINLAAADMVDPSMSSGTRNRLAGSTQQQLDFGIHPGLIEDLGLKRL